MRIVVLDGVPLNPGDLSWDPLEQFGECVIYDRTASEEVANRCAGAEILLANKTRIGGDTIEQDSTLRYIGVLATGYNNIDLSAASKHGVVVTNVPAYATDSVAQMVFAHILNLASGLAHHAGSVREGGWSSSNDWSYWNTSLIEVAGLTLGIVGHGRIGQAVGRLGRAFGMIVVAYDPNRGRDHSNTDVEYLSLDELFRRSDVVTLHCPLTEETRGLVNRDRLGMMKPSAVLINTSRGPLVDEAALAEALQNDTIAGAGLDVLAMEPPAPANALVRSPRCYITPHIAWATYAARKRLLDIAASNIAAFLAGHPTNVVSLR